jgi:hypothetical protein
MAELLVQTKMSGNSVERDTDMSRGDIVEARENRARWGVRESKQAWIAAGNSPESFPGDFIIVKIPDLPLSKAVALLKSERTQTEDEPGSGKYPVTKSRIWRLCVSEIPVGVRQALRDDGEYTATVAQIKAFVRSKIDERALDSL